MDNLFARKGEAVMCENGHIICTVANNIAVAGKYVPTNMYNWTQPEPVSGEKDFTKIICQRCGSLFWHCEGGQHFHFSDGWRTVEPSRDYRKKYTSSKLKLKIRKWKMKALIILSSLRLHR
jgi:hypothetical protein